MYTILLTAGLDFDFIDTFLHVHFVRALKSTVYRVGDTMYHIIFILYDIVTRVIFILDSENVFHTYSCQNRHVH